ncbi:MAG: AtpZ/AtpI family protein [Caulobacteraceae bacterium]|nr:AtpZ/AtpI family protein [Caulobacteraceae bacterium]
MPSPRDDSRSPASEPDPLVRLDRDLKAFEAGRQGRGRGQIGVASEGYRMLGQVLGGVLGGIGLGWLVDHFAHTAPFGVVAGLVIGAGLSVVNAVRMAQRVSARVVAERGVAPPAPDDEDEVD